MDISLKKRLFRLKSRTPSHTVLQYIEPRGASYFDTGYYPSTTTSVEYKVSYHTHYLNNLNIFLFGSRSTTTASDQFVIYNRYPQPYEGNNDEVSVKCGSWAFTKTSFPREIFPSVASVVKLGNSGFNFCGQFISAVSTTSFRCQYPMYIFTINQGGAPHDYYCQAIKFYGCKIYESGVLKRDYIPVLKNSVVALYDNIAKTYLHIKGSTNVGYN